MPQHVTSITIGGNAKTHAVPGTSKTLAASIRAAEQAPHPSFGPAYTPSPAGFVLTDQEPKASKPAVRKRESKGKSKG